MNFSLPFKQIAYSFLIALLSFSCSKKTENSTEVPKIQFSEEIAKEVSFVTNGEVHFDDQIQVIFNNPVIEENEVDSSPEDVFSFSHSLDGKAVWVSTSVLKFIPKEDLPMREKIEGQLDLQKLSSNFKEKNLENLSFNLLILGREISSFTGDLDLVDRNNPKKVLYSGGLSFTEKTSLEAVEMATEIEGGDIQLNWSKLDDKNFKFTSTAINRTDREQEFSFKIDKKTLNISNGYSEVFNIAPITQMKMTKLSADESGKKPRLRLTFSDDLDVDQDITGLVSISPNVKISPKKLGKAVILDGEFKFGESYSVTIEKGIRSKWGTKTENIKTEEISLSNIQPQIEFGSNGIILPSSNQSKIQFYTSNLQRVHLEVKKLYTNQIGQFLKAEQLKSEKTRNKAFNNDYSSTVGVIVKNQTIELKDKKNEWVLNEFDLSDLFSTYQHGVFLVRVNFTPSDVSIPIEGDKLNHIQEKGQIYKPLFISDLGITVKSTSSGLDIFATDLVTAEPASGVDIKLLDYNGNVDYTFTTGSDGHVHSNRSYFYYLLAEKSNQITALKKNEMQWSTSGFDVGGSYSNRDRTKAFIYTERGVYRPGDSVHVSAIVRNSNNTFPRSNKATITVRDPEYKIIHEATNPRSTDGLFVFAFQTEANAPTGNYTIRINAGGSSFSENLKIETVVAEKLKVMVKPEKSTFSWTDKTLDYDIESRYLFGTPASNLKTEVSVEILPWEINFPKYKDFNFSRADVEFKPLSQNVLKSQLDEEGMLSSSWVIPELGTIPSALKAKLVAKVFETGGQPNENYNVVELHRYPNYVGLKDPSGYHYYKTSEEVRFPVVLLDENGNKMSGKSLQYKIYRNDSRWWYQYNNRRNYQLKYKEDSQTYLETEGKITTSQNMDYISFSPQESGEYLIEVSDGGNGHVSSSFFSAYRYGSVPGGDLNEGNLALKADKEKYAPYETAKIKLPNPKSGRVLVTLEQGDDMIDWFWVNPSDESSDELILDIPIKKNMVPNVYATVSVIQRHEQTQNDRPIRMFGIIPIMVEDPDTKIGYNINLAQNLVPNEDFEVNINTTNGKKSQFTIAVVDEGLLSLTQFRTPNPWVSFYKKIGLQVSTYDVFSHIISANKNDVFQTFSIGGGLEMDYRESQTDLNDDTKRFKPVSMFKGPFMTDANGNASVKFHMPNYNGAVRVMVVGTQNGSYGHADKTVPVKSDIIMQPTIPRILKPGDEFTLPVALFKVNESVKTAKFDLKIEGPLEIIGAVSKTVDFSKQDDTQIKFKVRVKEAVGQAKIRIEGVSGNIKVENETDIAITPSATRVYDKNTVDVNVGKSIDMKVPKIGIEGTNYATLDINIFPNMDFEHRLKWLIRYPYGCIEQTVSSVFPQLYLKKMGYFDKEEFSEIDENINEGINRLQQFLLSDGSFSYWPGSSKASEWGTNYATHYLIEAKNLGYSVPDFMYDGAIDGLSRQSSRRRGKLSTRVNRVFILSLADKRPISEMNLLMENELSKMNNAERWMLAAAYHLSGVENVKENILSEASTETTEYEAFSYNFGSKYRDDAIILYCATLMEDMETAELMAKQVAKGLSSKDYLSTQSSGYMLLALGHYFDKADIDLSAGKVIKGEIKLSDGSTVEFNENGRFRMPVKNNFSQNLSISLSDDSNVDKVYAALSWTGVPLKDEAPKEEKNLSLEVDYYDDEGRMINPESTKQGQTFYARFRVKNTSPASRASEIALVQILPSGWQIDNTRLKGSVAPEWMNKWNINKEDYVDIRDDRAMWFFDLVGNTEYDFVMKLNAVSAGEYQLPATIVEAMYNPDYKARNTSKKVYVESMD
ncbi:alpha-2-macroglobulin family protein [Marivirga harenae]|uniref:alpha-2-macroglobulin family protein n=1 Tax=Marivirga harenae TaxID=2010992 RepID=UPI0026DF4295|nr:MG2 domain-containing protein [Marivirga harenae]WKV13756.1 MG2 domain-containing protein [Marivirga harenae]